MQSKFFSILCLVSFAATSYADDFTEDLSTDNLSEVVRREPWYSSKAKEVHPDPKCPPPVVQPESDPYVFTFGEFLYWRTVNADLDYASTAVGIFQPPNGTYTNVHFVKYKWDPGFKVGLGFFGENFWEGRVTYTRFKSRGSDAVSTDNTDPTLGTLILFDLDNFAVNQLWNSIQSKVRLRYNVLDLEGRRHKKIGRLLLGFPAGFRGATINQDWVAEARSNVSSVLFAKARTRWKIFGAGAKLAADINYDFAGGFGFYGKTSFSGLIVHERFYFTKSQVPFSVVNPVNIDSTIRKNKVIPVLDLEAGVAWSWVFRERRRIALNLAAGYQLTSWWNINAKIVGEQITNLLEPKEFSPLQIHGLVAHGGFDF